MSSRRSLHWALLNCSSPRSSRIRTCIFATVSDISASCHQHVPEPVVPVIARFYSTGRCVSVDMPVRPAHWLSSSCHILSDRLSAGFSCGLCSGRSAVLSSVQPADLLRPDSSALPVLPGISGRHFFSTVPHGCFPCSETRHQPAASAFPRTTVVVGLRRFPLPYQAPGHRREFQLGQFV